LVRFALANNPRLGPVPATAMSSSPFDGSWSVVVACAQAPDGAKAYRWIFTAQVRDGSFLGQYNQPGNIPSGTLSGQIQPAGNAHLTVDGLTVTPITASAECTLARQFTTLRPQSLRLGPVQELVTRRAIATWPFLKSEPSKSGSHETPPPEEAGFEPSVPP
jgi:hypothetical protein